MNGPDFIGQVSDIDSQVAFFPGVARGLRDDIQDVLLYAQLRAGHLYDFQRQWSSWMHSYRQHLQHQGFQANGIVTGDSLVVGAAEDLDRAGFSITNPQVSQRLVAQVRDSFASLGVARMADRFFQGKLMSARLGSFQMMLCAMVDSAEPLALLCSLRLTVDDHLPASRRLILHFKGGAYQFAQARYAPQRQKVRDYLAGKTRAFVRPLDLDTA